MQSRAQETTLNLKARPAGLEPATSWFVAQCRLLISLVLRGFSSGHDLLLLGVREQIVH